MSLGRAATMGSRASFPRVSGDEPPGGAIRYKTVMFSPRERG